MPAVIGMAYIQTECQETNKLTSNKLADANVASLS
jgi:hypothetical protein